MRSSRLPLVSLLMLLMSTVIGFANPPSPPLSANSLRGVWKALFTEDSSTIVIQMRDGSVHLAKVATGELLPISSPLSTIRGTVTLNPLASKFAVANPTHLQVFESTTGKALSPALAFETPESDPVLVFSPDDRFLAALSPNHHVHVFETTTWKEIATMAPAVEGTSADNEYEYQSPLLFSRDSQRLFFLSHTGYVQPINTKTWKAHGPILKHPHPDGYVFSQSLSPDDTQLITSDGPGENGPQGQLQLWDLASSKPIGAPISAQNGIGGTFLQPPDRLLLSQARGTGSVRQLPSFKKIYDLPAHDDVDGTHGQLTPDGQWLITSGSDTRLRLLDAQSGNEIATISLALRPESVLIEADSKHLLVTATELIQNDQTHTQTWNTVLTRLSLPELNVHTTRQIPSFIGTPVLSSNGNHLIILEGGSDDERLVIFDPETLQPLPWCADTHK
jgi:WD40 repeat protein